VVVVVVVVLVEKEEEEQSTRGRLSSWSAAGNEGSSNTHYSLLSRFSPSNFCTWFSTMSSRLLVLV